MANSTAFTKRDLAKLMKLLGSLQDYVESEIDCYCVPGSDKPSDPAEARILRLAKLKWRRAENMVKKLEAAKVEAAAS